MLQFRLTVHGNISYILHCFGVLLSEANTEAGNKTNLNLNLSSFKSLPTDFQMRGLLYKRKMIKKK